MLMTSIILLQGVSPLLAIATTVESSTVESSTSESTTDSNSVETPEVVTEEVPATEEQAAEPEYVDVEADYDENELSAEYQEDSAQPTVDLIEKNLTGEVTFKGEILAGIEQQETRRTETHLTKLVLQCSESDDSWEDVHTFEIEDDSTAIQVEKYDFDFSKSLDEVKAGNYRLIAEYDIKEYEEDSLKRVKHHKGMFVVGEVEEESEKEVSSSDTDASSQNLTQDVESSSNPTPFSGSLYAKNGLGRADIPGQEKHYSGDLTMSSVTITNIGKRTAKVILSNDSSDPKLRNDGIRYVVWSTSNTFMKNVVQPSNTPGTDIYNMDDAAWQRLVNSGNYKASNQIENGSSWRRDTFNLEGLSPQTYYYVWFIWETTSNLGGITVTSRIVRSPSGTTAPTGDQNVYNPFWFLTDVPDPLIINAPKFYHDTTTQGGTSIKMAGQRYFGDITQTNNQGRVEITDGTNTWAPITNLGHDLGTGTDGNHQYYNSREITGLTPGTRYQGRVMINDYLVSPLPPVSPWGGKDGAGTYFYTPNKVYPATVQSMNKPTTANNASATLAATYVVGAAPAHPSKAIVRYSTDNQNWTTINLGASAISQGKVNFTLSNLKAKTKYYVKVSVLNQSDVWSVESSNDFTTNGIQLKIDPPKFRQSSAGSDRIYMEPHGAYTGDAWHATNTGVVSIKPYGGNHEDKILNLSYQPHPTESRGTYSDATLYGLQSGTKYQAHIRMMDFKGGWVTSGINGQPAWTGADGTEGSFFYTANTIERPESVTVNNPTAANGATATVTAKYGAAAGIAGADPSPSWDNVRVEISTTSATGGFVPVTTSSTTGKLSGTPTVNTNNKRVTFTISNLATRKQYWVRCSVKNQSGNWATIPNEGTPFMTNPMPLKIDPPPTFDQNSATADSIYMNLGRFKGDVYQTNNGQGVVRVTTDGGHSDFQAKVLNLIHQTETSGAYYGWTIPDLEPGTKYQGQVELKDYNGNKVSSNWSSSFYTANRVKIPEQVAFEDLEYASTPNNAAATITAKYEASAGSAGADPAQSWNNVRVQISTTNDTTGFRQITTNSVGEKLTGTPIVDKVNKTVRFKLSGLTANQQYWVRCEVLNASTKWSGYPDKGRGFKTKGIDLRLDPPVLTQSSATTTSIRMQGQRYYGDITLTNSQGKVYLSSIGPAQYDIIKHDLGHNRARGPEDPDPPTYYDSYTITNLTPGTRYRTQVQIYNLNGEWRNSAWGNWAYTKNTIDDLTAPDSLGTPTSINDASAAFTAGYQAGGNDATESPAHPVRVKAFISRDGINYDEVETSSSSGPKLVLNANWLDKVNKKVTFTIEGLRENTQYYVKYSVVNEGIESEKSNPVNKCEFTTLSRSPGLYINEAPGVFDFGFVDYSDNELSHSLVNNSGDTYINFENINMNTNWTLSAKLSKLEFAAENLSLPGSKIRFNRSLEKTPDGTTWASADSSKFDGTIGISGSPIDLISNSGSVPLYKTTDIPYGQGNFRGVIPLNQVELIIPANTGVKGKAYTGEITWTLDDTL